MVKVFAPLVLIGALCGILLVFTHQITASDIQANRDARTRALLNDMLSETLPPQISVTEDVFGNCDSWLFVRYEVSGYAGPISLISLWRADSDGLTLRVLGHRETPGIGDFIDHDRNPWITQLDNAKQNIYAELDNVSGATITSNAIRRAADELFKLTEVRCEQ